MQLWLVAIFSYNPMMGDRDYNNIIRGYNNISSSYNSCVLSLKIYAIDASSMLLFDLMDKQW